ncbi:MAG: hypothetical protein LBN43_09575 [Oscillospiraceae bacterium]|nr:hypothetical protein [Oscillospiraceae bacterium]
MKKKLALLLALAMIAAMFAACGGSGGSTSPSPDATATAAPSASTAPVATDSGETPPEEEDEGTITTEYASYEVDEDGILYELYDYELPLTTSSESFSYTYSSIIPEDLPPEGVGTVPYFAGLREKTGVIIEYVVIPFMSRWENASIALASDDLTDLFSSMPMFGSTPMQKLVDENFLVNLYPYKDYFPNYYFDANNHPEDINVIANIIPYPETIFSFLCLESEYVTRNSTATRGDWLDRLGLSNNDIITVEDVHDVLVRYKNEMGSAGPYFLLSSLDTYNFFSAYDTVTTLPTGFPFTLIDNGNVQFTLSRNQDKSFMTMLNQWYNEGLFLPNWLEHGANTTSLPTILDGTFGMMGMIPGEANDYSGINNVDPNAYWVPLHKPVLTPGQTFHLGDVRTWLSGGSWEISADCENIPLLATYCDWFYSPEGIFYENYGVEGETFTYNDKGEPQLTDFIINHPRGMSWALIQYAICDFMEGGVTQRSRTYALPGGENLKAFHAFWDDPNYYRYDGTMQWPSAITLSPEGSARIAELGADVGTYISENYVLFVDGTKPLTEWDAYVDGLHLMGWDEALMIYQNAYEEFSSRFG